MKNCSGKKDNSHGYLNRREILKYGLYGSVAAGLSPGLWMGGCAKQPQGKRPNIIVLTVDTLRADHIGFHGYQRDTMPAIREFVQSALIFDNAVVSRSTTRPSYASMLTGLYPFHHGVYTNKLVLHEDITTLPEILKSAGYHTAAFVSNFVLMAELSGCDKGFDIYDDRVDQSELNRPNYERTAGNTTKAILEWLNSDPQQPFFLFTNFIDPHGPYHPPAHWRNLYQSPKKRLLRRQQIPQYQYLEGKLNYFDYIDLYDEEIRYVDEALGFLIEQLKLKGLWDDTLVIFTADHGESFGEHGIYFEHQVHLWEETSRVPLAIRFPPEYDNQKSPGPKRVGSVCSPMDLMPTILDYLDISSHSKLDGQSLLPFLKGPEDNERRLLLEFPHHCVPAASNPDIYAVRSRTHKLIRVMRQDSSKILREVVFDIAADPLEQRPLRFDKQKKEHGKLAAELSALLKQVRKYELPFTVTLYEVPIDKRTGFIEDRGKKSKKIIKQLSQEQIERLRSLGYVE